ncbi:hypothetical protein KORDIASMS9_03313 [Kordia sp. SMS9]|uniref:hypothetical protein n=1 Tax=Kordia sp. SMS9 TaxID=2282170 RepID=UPI000E0D8E36|nr:hypothetical protein [Kordia sp. SMS9]AXG71058.1 hypothetical protein KORDIASMS9_03313 [Kordia sp. SMS9]
MKILKHQTQISYVNNSANKNLPQVFIFAQNETPGFDTLKDGVAWKVIKDIGRGSHATFYYSTQYSIQVSWDNNVNSTEQIPTKIGGKYHVVKDATGIVLKPDGEASDPSIIEVVNDIEVLDGVTAQYCNNGHVMLEKKQIGHRQSAIFRPSQKIYFGLASQVSKGESLQSAVINSTNFFEFDLTGASYVKISLNGNAKYGYYFKIEGGG